MVFWNKKQENLKEEKYAKIFWAILAAIVLAIIIVFW